MGALMGIAVAIELMFGSFPLAIVRFPLNVILLALWLVLLVELYRRRERSRVAQALLSQRATVASLVLMAAVGIALGLQREPATTAWPTVVAVLFVLSHLTLVTLRGWRNGRGIRWRFVVNHAGLWLALVAGFWGAPDRHVVRMALERGERSEIAYSTDGAAENLGYVIELLDLSVEQDSTGRLLGIEADVVVDEKSATLSVNHPMSKGPGTKIYIVNDGSAGYAIIEIIDEPWYYISFVGIVMLLAGAVMMFVMGPKKVRG